MEPMTMPAISPPLRLVPPSFPSEGSATTVVVAWRLRISRTARGKLLVGVRSEAGDAGNAKRPTRGSPEKGWAGAMLVCARR